MVSLHQFKWEFSPSEEVESHCFMAVGLELLSIGFTIIGTFRSTNSLGTGQLLIVRASIKLASESAGSLTCIDLAFNRR